MQHDGARLEFDPALWAQWHKVHARVEQGRLIVEPVSDGAGVTVYDAWGAALSRFAFTRGQWREADTGADPSGFDESAAGRVVPACSLPPNPGLALAAERYRAKRPIRTPIIPGDEKRPREDSAIVQHLIRSAIAVALAGWVVVWLCWITYLVWKVWTRLYTGEWPKLTLRHLGLHYHAAWLPVQHVADYVLDLGLGWTFLITGTAVYIVLGGFVLFLLFTAIKLVEALVRVLHTTATAGAGKGL